MQVWKTTGVKPKQLVEQPPFPEELRYIWNWYLEMRTGEWLTFTEIKSWADLTSQSIKAWEVDLIRTLDRLYWSVIHD